jgi:putative nucleotidyltransferase with HDIG domain
MNLELKRALFNISALVDLGQEITSEKNLQTKIQTVLHVILGTFLVRSGAILECRRGGRHIFPIAQKGLEQLDSYRFSLEQIRGAAKNEPFLATDLPDLHSAGAELIVPLWVRDEFLGLIVLSEKFTGDAYSDDDFELLKVIANQIALTLHHQSLFQGLSEQLNENRRLYVEMRRIYHDTLQAFAAAIDAKDVYTRHHSQRVAKYSVAIARELGWNEHDVEGIYIAGFLHDVGKLAISNELLNKKAPFTKEEFEEIQRHSVLSHQIISKIKFPWKDVENIIRHHHERLDGCGYPDALKREDLSEGVKILSLADSFDAMTSERAYRKKRPLIDALDELKNCLNTQFDDKIMLAFCRVLDKEIKGELPDPNILPNFDENTDFSIISGLLEGIIEELSAR